MSKSFTAAEVATHKSPDDLWLIISGEVYDVTKFQHTHPGGQKILKAVAGKDATKPFKKNHNERILKNFQYKDLCIGVVAAETSSPAPSRLGRVFSWGGKKKTVHVEVQEIKLSKVSSLASEETVDGIGKESGLPPTRLLVQEIGGKKAEEALGICEVMKRDVAILAL